MLMASYNNGMRMLSVLPRVTERTRERVAREFDDLGPDVCMNSIMRDLQRHNPELLDMASKWANDVGAADRIITAFGMFYRLLSAEMLWPLEPQAVACFCDAPRAVFSSAVSSDGPIATSHASE
jgi:hypothetical protein